MPSNPLRPTPPPCSDSAVPETQATNQPTAKPVADGAAPKPLLLQAGEQPVPDYELVRRLGKGGFGEVWQARGPGGLDFALKFIQLEARGSQLEERALETMKSIRHPNLVGLSGIWKRDGLLIVAMELCDGSLQDRLDKVLEKKQPGLPVNELLKYLRDAASGLDALHAKGVQHRDVKPQNLLLMQGGVKVADFGLAKMLDHTAASHTGAMTVSYAAPEFFQGTTSQQSDQYSLAATYVHLRTGHLLFEGSYHQVVYGHMSVSPDLSQLPAAEQAVLARALAKEPEKRWRNCITFVNELIKAHKAGPSEPLPPPQKEAPPQPKRAGKQAGALAKLLAQPTIPLPPSKSRRDSDPTEPRKPEKPAKAGRQSPSPPGNSWFRTVVVGLLLAVLVTCGAIGALSIGRGLFSNPATEGQKLPSSLVVDLGNSVPMEFILIDPKTKPDGGKFKMGSPDGDKDRFEDEKQHDVELTKPYYLGKYVVTQEQYKQVTGDNPSLFRADGFVYADKLRGQDTKKFPVDSVTWDNADGFCAGMTKKCGNQLPAELRQKGFRFALPTEAQWEYACRAGTKARYFFGDNNKQLGDHAWFKTNSGERPHAVTEKNTANPWGLYDMHGNMWQWCADYYDAQYYANGAVVDPLNSKKPDVVRRVLRGGSWCDTPGYCRATTRYRYAPEIRYYYNGFRVCVRVD